MKRFEHTIIQARGINAIEIFRYDQHGEQHKLGVMRTEKFSKYLSDLGSEGWEVTSQHFDNNQKFTFYTLKREISED